VLVAIIADRLGRHRLPIKRLLAKAKTLPPRSIPTRKKGSGCAAVISKHALKVMERFEKKNLVATASDFKEKVPEVAAVLLQHIWGILVEEAESALNNGCHKPLLTMQMKAKRLGQKIQALGCGGLE
jgi:hypothetical protein